MDKQRELDPRRLRIDKVGIKGLRYPINFRLKSGEIQATIATIGLFVDLPPQYKGTHMSRFLEILHSRDRLVDNEGITRLLAALQSKLRAQDAHLQMEFPVFLSKRAPISQGEGWLDYGVHYQGTARGRDLDLVQGVKVNVNTLCPCSKAISRHGAHNQRGTVTVHWRSQEQIWVEDMIRWVERSASSELYSLLKRADEKMVTEHAYENPVFVEDLIRNVAVQLNSQPSIRWYQVEAENFESIHNHNAYASIEKQADPPLEAAAPEP